MHKSNFISVVSWVPKGASKEVPNKLQMSQDEIQMKIEQQKELMKEMYELYHIPFYNNLKFILTGI